MLLLSVRSAASGAALLVLFACTEEPASVDQASTTVRVAFNTQQIGTVSTLARVSLQVNRGTVTPADQPFVYGQGTAEFAVTAPIGSVTFTANVVSNTNVPLYAATETRDIFTDQFQIILPLAPVDGVLLVFPDTLTVFRSTSYRLQNVGVRNLAWTATASCTGSPCFTMRGLPGTPAQSQLAGTLPPGRTDSITVLENPQAVPRPTTIRLTTSVGNLNLLAIPAIVIPAAATSGRSREH